MRFEITEEETVKKTRQVDIDPMDVNVIRTICPQVTMDVYDGPVQVVLQDGQTIETGCRGGDASRKLSIALRKELQEMVKALRKENVELRAKGAVAEKEYPGGFRPGDVLRYKNYETHGPERTVVTKEVWNTLLGSGYHNDWDVLSVDAGGNQRHAPPKFYELVRRAGFEEEAPLEGGPSLRAVKILREAFLRSNTEGVSQELWCLLTALRGPDEPGMYQAKKEITAVLRGFVCPSGFVKRVHFESHTAPDACRNLMGVLADLPVDLSEHWGWHAKAAVKVVQEAACEESRGGEAGGP